MPQKKIATIALKINSIIKSCNRPEQLRACRKMISFFLADYILTGSIASVDTNAVGYYYALLSVLKDKEQELI